MPLSRVKRTWATQFEVATPELLSVIGGAVLVMAGFGLVVPAIPLFAKKFGVGDIQVSWLVSGFVAMRLLGNGVAGRTLKRYGERSTTVAGALIVGASSLAAGAAPSFWWLFGFRVAGGVGSAFYFAGLLSFLLARVKPDQRGRAMSLFQASVAAGLLAGPIIGGIIIAVSSENVPFYLYGAACIAGAVWSAKTMAKPVAQHALGTARPNLVVLRELLRDRAYRISLVVAMMGFVVVMAPQVLLPTMWVDELGSTEATLGVPFAVMTAAGVAAAPFAGTFVDRRGRRGAMIGGSFLLAAGLGAVALGASPFVVAGGMGIAGIATGYTRPASTSVLGDVAAEDQRDAAMGGFRVAQDLGGLLGAAMSGPLSAALGPNAAFGVLGGIAVLVALACLSLRETAPHLQPVASGGQAVA